MMNKDASSCQPWLDTAVYDSTRSTPNISGKAPIFLCFLLIEYAQTSGTQKILALVKSPEGESVRIVLFLL